MVIAIYIASITHDIIIIIIGKYAILYCNILSH